MMVVRDIKNELAALREKELELQARHAEQLVRLLQETGADQLEPALLAGILMTAVDEKSEARLEEWRERGAAMFRPARQRRRKDAAPAAAAGNGTRAAAPPAPAP